ncbi:ricin B lectin domain-containing protein [Gymnopilus junonius]|uniref:Ricin B lectin domain-containing protein n=1 Tax=Gymnopilus junonius TaxID=109634 RepID=A0A9P5NAG9_GYMJU|nr:ricin B lectin domain-containing protein [Gymnopilus junonius]
MKLAFVLLSVFAAAQAQFSIGAPPAGATLVPGSKTTVQVIVPIDTSAEAGEVEVSLVIGIVGCGTAACPAPTADLGEPVFIGKYQSQGTIGNTLNSFENITVTVPTDISGAASIQVQRVSLATPPGHSIPGIQYLSQKVNVGSGSGSSGSLNIHPNGDNSKCVGILGGVYADGSAVDIYDCNASASQKWQFNGNALQSVNPADGSQWCLDAGVQSTWADGLKMKVWQCFSDLPQQSWTPITSSGSIKLNAANFCLDLTNGVKTNQNVFKSGHVAQETPTKTGLSLLRKNQRLS